MLGRVNRSQSLRALDLAWEHGVRHFDVARSYGWGDAEGVLGDFLATRALDQCRVVTKCGIVPQRRSRLGTIMRVAARSVYRRMRASRATVRALAGRTFQPQTTQDPTMLRHSFEQSLRELRVEHVDLLLLHQFAPGATGLDEIIEWFQAECQRGRIGSYGVCINTDLRTGVAGLRREWLGPQFVIQTSVSDLFVADVDVGEATIVAHSPFRFLSAQTGHPSGDLATLTTTLAALPACQTLVCSMFSERHIRENCRALEDGNALVDR